MPSRISYAKPSITELEISSATEAATLGWGTQSNFYIEKFEREFAAKLAVPMLLQHLAVLVHSI